MGELSHAARLLSSPGIAPGTQQTLDELRNPALRPTIPSEPFPQEFQQFRPRSDGIRLDKHIFGNVLRTSRRGQSAGLSGGRCEYYKICLEDTVAFDVLFNVAELLARSHVPSSIRDVLQISTLTAIRKPNNKVRGIAAGDSFRRLVAKTMAKQFRPQLENAVKPFNFGLCDRSGTDSAVHLLQYLTDAYPGKVIVSIDGVGAFDHVCRARMFE